MPRKAQKASPHPPLLLLPVLLLQSLAKPGASQLQ
jgi:hypothetical protein